MADKPVKRETPKSGLKCGVKNRPKRYCGRYFEAAQAALAGTCRIGASSSVKQIAICIKSMENPSSYSKIQ